MAATSRRPPAIPAMVASVTVSRSMVAGVRSSRRAASTSRAFSARMVSDRSSRMSAIRKRAASFFSVGQRAISPDAVRARRAISSMVALSVMLLRLL